MARLVTADFSNNAEPCVLRYTTVDNSMLEFDNDAFDAEVISHSYENGEGKIVFDNFLTSIAWQAFSNCALLASIFIPDGVTRIENSAFWDCASLKAITIPNSVTSIGGGAFCGTSLTKVIIPTGVTSIGGEAFRNCTLLTEVIIPNSIYSIGDYAFAGCVSLSNITIPDSVTKIGCGIFKNCKSLVRITVDARNLKYDSRYNCNAIIETATNSLIEGCNTTIIPNNITTIGDRAFQGRATLTSINIPDSIANIGLSAFSDCINLEGVYITSLSAWCNIDFGGDLDGILRKFTNREEFLISNPLYYAHNLYVGDKLIKELYIPNDITIIKKYAFVCCSSLTSVIFHDLITTIEDGAFQNCSNLLSVKITNLSNWCNIKFEGVCANPLLYAEKLYLNNSIIEDLIIPNDVVSVGNQAFCGYKWLKSVRLGENVRDIGTAAFSGCSRLSKFYGKFSAIDNNCLIINNQLSFCAPLCSTEIIIPEKVVSIGSGAFFNCENIPKIEIPENVTYIGDHAFSNCKKLENIIIPNGVTELASGIFSGCCNLKSINIPEGIITINEDAFYSCSSLASISLPANIIHIKEMAFAECYNLKTIVCKATKPPKLDLSAFDINKNAVIIIPKESQEEYINDNMWIRLIRNNRI